MNFSLSLFYLFKNSNMSRIKEIEDYVKRLYESVETVPRGDEAKQLAADLTTTLGTSIMDKHIGKFTHISIYIILTNQV